MEQAAVKSAPVVLDGGAGEYLAFALGDEEYGIELLKVQEIKGYSPVTPIPNTPPHIKGVMNLRGAVIPIIDLRMRFGMPAVEYNQFNVIIVINVDSKIMGLLVDAVSDVLNVGAGELRAAPDFGTRADTRFISGMVSAGDKIAVLLDITTLLSEDDLAVAEAVAANAAMDAAPAAAPAS
jgi:purine-binding chemotaxis protein CheW